MKYTIIIKDGLVARFCWFCQHGFIPLPHVMYFFQIFRISFLKREFSRRSKTENNLRFERLKEKKKLPLLVGKGTLNCLEEHSERGGPAILETPVAEAPDTWRRP